MQTNVPGSDSFTEENPAVPAEDSPASLTPETRTPPKKQKKRGFLLRLVSFLVMLVLVLGAVVVVVFRDQLNIDALRRSIAYRQLERSETGQCTEFQYETDSSNQFASYRNGLLVASSTNITLFDQSGQTRFSEKVPMSSPAIAATENFALVYDIGGSRLLTFSEMQVGLDITTEENAAIFSAGINDSGYVALVSQGGGYKSVVDVYNDQQTKVFRWNSSSHFVTDAAVFNDCKTMGAVTIGTESMQYKSRLVLYRLDSETQYAAVDLGNHLVLAVRPMGALLCVMTDGSVLFVNSDGAVVGSYEFDSDSLNAFTMEGDGFSVVETDQYQAGSFGQLVSVDPSGAVLGTLSVSDDAVSISGAGRYVAVLYSNHMDIYDRTLTLYARLEDTGNTRKILMRTDGSAMCVGMGAAWLYLPS